MNRSDNIKSKLSMNDRQILPFLVFVILFSTTIYSSTARPTTITENILDGTISTGEYSHSQSVDEGNFILHWQTTQENFIFFALQVITTGWVSIGIDPSVRMKDADMYFGWVDSNSTVDMVDAFSTGDYGPHPPDSDLGGTNDILEFSGSEIDDVTIIEFKRAIVTPDSNYDNPIPLVGEITIIWGYGTTDNYLDQHAGGSRGTMFWTLEGASILKYDFSQPLILGITFFATLTVLLIYVDSKGRPKSDETKKEKGDL